MRWSGRIFWLLAYHPAPAGRTFFPPSPPNVFGDWPWEVVSSYSSATAPDLHGISRADPLFQARKELDPELLPCSCALKTYFGRAATNRRPSPTIAPSAASAASSLAKAWTIVSRFSVPMI